MELALRELEDLLPGANYLVELGTITVPFSPGWTPEQYITKAVGPKPPLLRVVGVSLPELLAEVEHCLRYDRGQYNHLANPPHHTARFGELVADVRGEVTRLAAASSFVARFWLDDLIEWQFSFLFFGPTGGTVFSGWGSD